MRDWVITYTLVNGSTRQWLAMVCDSEIDAMRDFLSHCQQAGMKPMRLTVEGVSTPTNPDQVVKR